MFNIVSNPEQTAVEEQRDSNSEFSEHLKEIKAVYSLDYSHLDTCDSISQINKQLPQLNNTNSSLKISLGSAPSMGEEK